MGGVTILLKHSQFRLLFGGGGGWGDRDIYVSPLLPSHLCTAVPQQPC